MITFFIQFFRQFKKHLFISITNLLGLSLSLAAFSLIAIYVHHNYSVDKFNKNYDRIFRMYSSDQYALTTVPIGEKLIEKCPDIENYVRLYRLRGSISYNNNSFSLRGGFYADTAFFKIFTYESLYGDLNTALENPYSIVLTESMSKKLFKDKNPVGKSVKFENGDEYLITAVIKDLKEKSHLGIETAIVSFNTLKDNPKIKYYEMCALSNYLTYLLLPEQYEKYGVFAKIDTALNQLDREIGCASHYKLQSLNDAYFNYKGFDYTLNGTKSLLIAFVTSGIMLLLIAFINFINLSTATALHRGKEVGLKKVVGAQRINLIFQFIGETVLLSLIASIIALIFVTIFYDQFKVAFDVNAEIFLLINFIVFFTVVLIFGILASIIPAISLSRFNPIAIIKGEIIKSKKGAILRKALLIFQFSITIGLVISSLFVQKQLSHMTSSDNIGFELDNLYYFRARSLGNQQDIFKQEVMKTGLIKNFAYCWARIGTESSTYGFEDTEGNNHSYSPYFMGTDFVKTMGVEIVEGRDIDVNISSDNTAFLVNETAARNFGWDNPIGMQVDDKHCIGVVKDYHIKSFKRELESQILFYDTTLQSYANIRFFEGKEKEGIDALKKIWDTFVPNTYLDIVNYNDYYNDIYKTEITISKVFKYFTIISFAIAVLGLIGIISFIVDQRLKKLVFVKL